MTLPTPARQLWRLAVNHGSLGLNLIPLAQRTHWKCQSYSTLIAIREARYQNATVCFKELCGLSLLSNLKQCILILSSRLQSGQGPPGATLTVRDSYPYLEPQGSLPEATRKLLHSYDSGFQVFMTDHRRVDQWEWAGLTLNLSTRRLNPALVDKGMLIVK
ncbi:UNVERIFIED_CONTAM: hypothetical protein FKN15_046625 [Acipenser sinensis]